MPENIVIKSDEETRLRKILEGKKDTESERLKRFLNIPDLTRTLGSPLHEMIERIMSQPEFKSFDTIKVPEITPTDVSFDLFDFPPEHPARSRSDTYYVDDKNILRTHTTVMWYYFLTEESIKTKILNGESVGAFSYGKVYRKDEIDRHHMNVFHQMDGWFLTPKYQKIITSHDLENVLAAIAKAVFGPEVKYRFNPDKFPYTDPSLEMEIDKGNEQWVEVLGAGVVKGSVLDKLGVDSSKYNGWAFGFGLERLAIISMELPDIRLLWSQDERVKLQLKLGNKFKEVSKFPPVLRDISFVVNSDFIPNDYFDTIRDVGGDMVEQVELLDKYENVKKFEAGKLSYTFRITYRHLDRTLTNEEVNKIHAELEQKTETDFKAEIRRV